MIVIMRIKLKVIDNRNKLRLVNNYDSSRLCIVCYYLCYHLLSLFIYYYFCLSTLFAAPPWRRYDTFCGLSTVPSFSIVRPVLRHSAPGRVFPTTGCHKKGGPFLWHSAPCRVPVKGSTLWCGCRE
jgi:hypothetical protein